MNKEKASIELTLKNILYFIDDENEQNKMLEILIETESKIPDSKLKNLFQKHILNSKKDYYDKVDYLIRDILEGDLDNNTKLVIKDMLSKIKAPVEKAEKSFWERLISVFSGS